MKGIDAEKGRDWTFKLVSLCTLPTAAITSCFHTFSPKSTFFLECRWIHDPTIEKDSRINLIYRNLVRNIFSSSEELSDNSKNLYRNRRNDFHVHSSGWLELCRMIIHGMSSNDSQHQFWDQVDRQWIAINIRRYKFYF